MKIKILAAVLIKVVLACSAFAASKKQIVFGVVPGPYSDIMKLGLNPGLEKKGYKIAAKEFSVYVQPNIALDNKSIDVNVFQYVVYENELL